MSEKTPINKGNYDMETPERLALFEKYRALGWEEEYQAYRRNWVEYAKNQCVSEYPLLVDIELSTVCNLHCPMCYTITEEFKKSVSKQFMDWALFQKIVDEIGGKVPAVRLSLRGEPTLHPEFVSCIRYCKEKGIGEVSFLTNGSKLNEELFVEIAEAGASWITVSIDGVGKTYEHIRRPLRFADTLQKLKDIHKIKAQKGWKRPVIKIQSIWPAIQENPSEFYNTFEPYVDLIAFNPLISGYSSHDTSGVVYMDAFSCPQIYQRLVIGADGRVLLCSNDEEGRCILGDVNKQSVYEIWHSEALEKVRRLHKKGAFRELEVCGLCYLPRETKDKRAFVNDREIIIKNYV